MLRSVKSIYGYKIAATDGTIGKAHDVYFDDENWAIRYLVVDTGTLLTGHKVLIFPIATAQPDWKRQVIPVGLSKDHIENSPPIDKDKPVSKQHEIDLHTYFNLAPYWTAGMGGPWGTAVPPMPEGFVPPPESDDESGDPHLRSTRELTGYHLQALGGEIGHVEDFIVDDESWHVRYMVIKTKNWLPGKKVILPPAWIERFSWKEKKVFCELSRDEIKNAPEYDPEQPINRDYEIQYYDYYGRPAYF